jgi:hypothetical protein
MITDSELSMEQLKTAPTVFNTILDPLLPLLRAKCAQLKDDATLYTLSSAPFVINFVLDVIRNLTSLMVTICFSSRTCI